MNLSDFEPMNGLVFLHQLDPATEVNGLATSGDLASDVFEVIDVASIGNEEGLVKGDLVIAPRLAGSRITVGGVSALAIHITSLTAKKRRNGKGRNNGNDTPRASGNTSG